MEFFKRNIVAITFSVLFLLTFLFNGRLSLWDQDEAAYAGFAQNMIETGNWLIPDYMWSDIHRKPPLHFWNIALSYKIFGVNEFSVRFPSALAIFLTYLLTYLFGKRFLGKNLALLSALVLGTTLFLPTLAKVSVTDATLLLFSTVCGYSLFEIMRSKELKWVFIFWASFALAMLTKGPPILIFTGILSAILFVFHPQRKNIFRLRPWFFLPIAFVPLFLWGYFTNKSDGGVLINWMIDWYILKRVSGSVLGQSGPPGMHLLFIFVFFLPYLMFFPKAFWKIVTSLFKGDKENLFLGAWFISGWLIYEFSPSKLPAYSVVAHVPLAIFVAKEIYRHFNYKTKPHLALQGVQFVLVSLIPIGLFIAALYLKLPLILTISAGVFSLTTMAMIFVVLKSKGAFVKNLLILNAAFQFFLILVILPQIDFLKNSPKQVARYINENCVQESRIILANKKGRPPSLPFYISQHFEEITEDQNLENLKSYYTEASPYVLVLTNEQMNALSEWKEGLTFKEISSFATDRKSPLNYYILLNPEAEI